MLKDYFQEFIDDKEHKIMFFNRKKDIFEEFKVIDAINLLEEKDKEIERLNNIIKEVREWAKKCSCQFTNDDGELVVSEISFNIQARPCDLFNILDKGE